jgi:hypothetical protein
VSQSRHVKSPIVVLSFDKCQYNKSMKIEFDADKDAANVVKHGLSLSDAGLVYNAPNKLTLASPRADEARKLDLALVEVAGVVLALVYEERDEVVRAISLRRASRTERRLYEDAKQD